MKIEDLNPEDRTFVDSIHATCTRSGDCLMWDGKTTNSGYPKAHIDGKYRMVRRALLEKKIGRPLRSDEVASSKCDDPMCMEWGHIKAMTTAERRKRTGAAGKLSTMAKAVNLAKAGRRHSAHTMQTAENIRSDPRPSHEVAPEYDMSPSMVRKIRRNEAWKAYGSMAVGLGAR